MTGEVVFNIKEIAARHPWAKARMAYNYSMDKLHACGMGYREEEIKLVTLVPCLVTVRTPENLILPRMPKIPVDAGTLVFESVKGRLFLESI